MKSKPKKHPLHHQLGASLIEYTLLVSSIAFLFIAAAAPTSAAVQKPLCEVAVRLFVDDLTWNQIISASPTNSPYVPDSNGGVGVCYVKYYSQWSNNNGWA